jgi:replicative DNA helicase
MADKLPPQNLDAEKSVLGAILLDKNAIIEVAQFLRPEHFYSPLHATIYEAVLDLFAKGEPADILTVSNALKKQKKLEKVGGAVYLTELAESVPTSSNSEYYGVIVKDAAIRRSLITVSGDINELGYNETIEVNALIDEAEKRLFQVANDGKKTDFVHIKELLKEAYERAEELGQKQNQLRGVPTGFKDVDGLLGGLQESNLIIIAARPSVGKSSFALDIARHATLHEQKAVGIFSLEMSNVELTDRLIASQVGMNLWDYRMGHIKDDDMLERLGDVMGQLSEIDLYLDDTPGQTIMEIRTKARRLSMEKKLDLIIIDYLQLITSSRAIDNRVQEVGEISRSLKNLARELHVPVIALSQLSRAVESRSNRTPQLSDLRESGSIEQDADIVIFLNREDMYNPETEKKNIADIIVAKHRNGPIGNLQVYFKKELASFRDLDQKR